MEHSMYSVEANMWQMITCSLVHLILLTNLFHFVLQDAVKKLPALRPLCMILKVFLHQRELNEVHLY
jgi:hypothetical protein